MDNYFERYDLPVKLVSDKALVRKKFLEISKSFHPDRFATADEAAKMDALSQSAINNNAYKTLMDDDATMEHVLHLKGFMADDEHYKLPPAFLMEMMELNEVVSDYEMEGDAPTKEAALKALDEAFAMWEESTGPLKEHFDKGKQDEQIMLALKDFYFRKKYLLRIRERLDTFAS